MSSSSPEPPRWTFAVATVIWALFVGFAVRLALATFVPAVGGTSLTRWFIESPLGLALSAAFVQCTLLAMAMMRLSLMPALRRSLEQGLRHRPSRALTSVAFILGLAPFANLCGIAAARLTGTSLAAIEVVGALVRRATPFEVVVLALALSALPAIVEETIFRGLVLGTLDEFKPHVALATSALAFGIFHLDVAQGTATLILGLGFGFVAQTTGTLLGAMLAHASYNLLVLLTQRFMPATDTRPAWQVTELGGGIAVAVAAGSLLHRLRVTLPSPARRGGP